MDKLLGDYTAEALKKIGADKLIDFYERKTGRSCNCGGRQQMLNTVHRAAQRMVERQLKPRPPVVDKDVHKPPTKPVDE